MERPHKPKRPYNGNTKYDDVFGGPPKFKTSLSPRLEDYSEIFSRVSSIPILDLPTSVNNKDVYVDVVRSNGFDYREVFGGFNDLDSTPSYDELFVQPSRVVDGGDSSDDAWTHEEVDSVTERSKSCFSNGRDSCDSIDGCTEFNISYNKASQMNGTNMSSGGVIHVADLGAINGYTVAVDGTRKGIGPPSVGRGMTSSKYGFQEKDGGQEYYRESFVTVSEIGLKTDPTGIPPPSRPAPALKSDFRSSCSNSRTTGSQGSADGNSLLFFDVEVDASSAALREAMVNAELKLKSAKELFERKRDGVRTTTKQSSMKNRVMNEEGRSLRDKRGSKSFSSRESTNSDGNDEWEEATEFVELVRTEQPRNADENSGGKDVSFPLNAGFFDQKMSWAANVEWENQQRRGKGDRKDHEAKRLPKHPGARKVASRPKRHEDRLAEKAHHEEPKHEKLRDVELEFVIGNSLPDHDGIMKHRNLRRPEENKLLSEKLAKQKDLHCEEKTKSRQDQQSDRIPHQKAAANPGMFNWEQNARKLREALGLANNESTLEVSLESEGNGKSLGICGEKEESETKLNDALRRMEEETRSKEARLNEESDRREREAFAKAENEKKVKATIEQAEKVKKLKEAREREENERRAADARKKAEQEEYELRLKEAFEKEEQNRRMREARDKAEQERKMREQEEYELRLKEAFEKEEKNRKMREVREKAEFERKTKIALEQERERKIKEAREKEENERRIKEAREKAEMEQRWRETFEQEEKQRRIKEIQEREENERRAKEVLEQAENERKLKEALEQKEKERKLKEARDREENEKKLKEAIELEEKEKRLLEAFERAETERRLKEDLEQEEMRLQEAKEEEERAHREDQEHQENETNQHEFTREESVKKQRDACETTEEAHGEPWPKETHNDTLEDDESVESADAVDEQEEAEPSQRVSVSEESCPWKVFEKNLKDASQTEGTNDLDAESGIFEKNGEETQLNGESSEESTSVADNIQGGKDEQHCKKFESSKDASVLNRDVGTKTEVEERSDEDKKVGGVQRNPEERMCTNKTSSSFRDPENKYTRQPEKESIYETQEGLNKDPKLERPLPSQVYEQREKEAERLKRERDLETERLRKVEEEREREREREKDRMAFDQRALADARERLEKACAEAREKSLPDKITMEARLRAERAAVERATTEARERAAEKAAFEARERMERSISDKHFQSSGLGERMERSVSDKHFQNSASFGASRYQNGTDGESPQRYTSRLERHRRTADRVAKALAEKNMRDLVAQREQTERTRIAETLDADVKRWSNGKEGNIRALLSTLQYILGTESGWQPLPLTEVITSAAVKRAYRKATLCVHPDKLQQRGANIHQKYICEKVFDLLKEAWNRFNSEER